MPIYPMHEAAGDGNLKKIRSLIKKGSHDHLTTLDPGGRTVLIAAVQGTHKDVVNELLSASAPINAPDLGGNTPLHHACLLGLSEIAELLITRGAYVHAVDGTESEQERVQREADGTDRLGNTPLHAASMRGHQPIVEALLAAGAAVDPVDERGQTPLMRACANGWAAVAEILLQKGANINHTDIFGRTALHRAAGTGRPTVIALLLNSSPKADIVARTNDGWTALHFAARIGAVAVASKLIKGGADVHAKCNYGFTAEDVVEQYKNGRWKETKEVLQLAS